MTGEKNIIVVKAKVKSRCGNFKITKHKRTYELYNNYINQENTEIDNAIFTLDRLCVKK